MLIFATATLALALLCFWLDAEVLALGIATAFALVILAN